MKRLRTIPARWAAAANLGIAILAIERLVITVSTVELVLLTGLAAMSAFAAVLTWFHNSFESQLLSSLVSAFAGVGTLLGLTVGLPGIEGRADPSVASVGMLVLSVVIVALLVQDARVRREHARRVRRSYAR